VKHRKNDGKSWNITIFHREINYFYGHVQDLIAPKFWGRYGEIQADVF
jgi:hypothetical protein